VCEIVQVLAKAECKALHAYWTVLFPVQSPLSRQPDALTLMDVIASDPVAKVCPLWLPLHSSAF
jgi:hypothetical protein